MFVSEISLMSKTSCCVHSQLYTLSLSTAAAVPHCPGALLSLALFLMVAVDGWVISILPLYEESLVAGCQVNACLSTEPCTNKHLIHYFGSVFHMVFILYLLNYLDKV